MKILGFEITRLPNNLFYKWNIRKWNNKIVVGNHNAGSFIEVLYIIPSWYIKELRLSVWHNNDFTSSIVSDIVNTTEIPIVECNILKRTSCDEYPSGYIVDGNTNKLKPIDNTYLDKFLWSKETIKRSLIKN